MNIKATRRRMISCFAQIINDYVLGYKIPELVRHEKIKARKLSYDSQMYLLMLGQFLHVFSLNELVDISKIYAKELSRFKRRNIYAIDSTTITLAYWCINWAKHRQHKAARPCADMGCAFDASGYAIYQVQVSGSVQLFALRRIHPSRYLAEKGSYAEPLVLWDSTSPGKRSPTRKCAVSAGV